MNTSFKNIREETDNRFKTRMNALKDVRLVQETVHTHIYDFTKRNIVTESFDKDRHFKMDVLDIDKFVKVNELKEVTNPVFFVRDGVPSSDGLLSNEIFGITKEERAGTFAYIELGDTFLHPLCYKIWSRLDSKIVNIVHGTSKYIISSTGDLIEDNIKGETGVKFLQKNFDRIHIKSTGTTKRDVRIKFLKQAYSKGVLFCTKWPIMPAYYRDVDTSRGRTTLGEINEMYSALMNACRALKSSYDYGLTLSGATRGRIQEALLNIYNWCTDEPQISKKFGILKRANMSKTTDYACRLVISSPSLHGEHLKDIMVDTDHCAVPLAAACVTFYPFIMYYLTSFFNKELSGRYELEMISSKTGELQTVELGNWQETFSPLNLKAQLDRFIHGFSNRFIPIEIPTKNLKYPCYFQFKGNRMSEEEYAKTKGVGLPDAMSRTLTWCDLFYMAAVEVTKDRCVLITRYPIDSCYNQYPSLVRIASTTETEPMVINGQFYPHYPKIREEYIGKDTSNMFIDTLQMSNAMVKVMGGDYDGDQVTLKGAYFEESNKELREYINSKRQFIDLSGTNMRIVSKEGAQSLYSLTLILPDAKVTEKVKLG